jgi:hypothetical protein
VQLRRLNGTSNQTVVSPRVYPQPPWPARRRESGLSLDPFRLESGAVNHVIQSIGGECPRRLAVDVDGALTGIGSLPRLT